MTFENLIYEIKDNVCTITINRPKVLNALNQTTIHEIGKAIAEAEKDENVRVIIFIGSAEKSFVAGADINELALMNPMTGKETSWAGQSVALAIENCSKPVIAAINGFTLGGGCELALACHIRIAGENAVFGLPELGLGIIPGFGGTQRLPRLVGKGKALEIMLTGDFVNAEEAYRIGLVNKVIKHTEFMEIEKDGKKKTVPNLEVTRENVLKAALEMAQKIVTKAPISIKCGIEAVTRGLEMNLYEGLCLESNLFGLISSTEDMKEGMNAFLEKRKPTFKNK
ncbi:enoyl-CoA hydratase/isomerase family protein [bacterium]|nr:enoyl-CoA hydratase/isomerase family protein [bacterium]